MFIELMRGMLVEACAMAVRAPSGEASCLEGFGERILNLGTLEPCLKNELSSGSDKTYGV